MWVEYTMTPVETYLPFMSLSVGCLCCFMPLLFCGVGVGVGVGVGEK